MTWWCLCEREQEAVAEPDSLCRASFMSHAVTDLGCLRLSTSLPPLLHSPTPSLSSCPLPVIACQINVPLCSQAQKLSCHIQPLLPLFFFFLIWFSAMLLLQHHHHHHLPLSSPRHCVSSVSTRASSLSCFLQTAFLMLCCLSSSVCSVPSPEMETTHTPLFPSISAGLSPRVRVRPSSH